MSLHTHLQIIEKPLVFLAFWSNGSIWSTLSTLLIGLGRSLGGKRHLRRALGWIRRGMVDLNDLKASSEQNWEPEGTPRSDRGASKPDAEVSVTSLIGRSTEG